MCAVDIQFGTPVNRPGASMDDFALLRERMVGEQLMARGISDQRVLRAMSTVPREEFVPTSRRASAYLDAPLPIEENQTISQPYSVAYMAELLTLKPEDRVLDVGTGSGYAAAVVSRIVETVYSIERNSVLASLAEKRFNRLGYDNICVCCGDGSLGWPEYAPFDAIGVAACSPNVPEPLEQQLAVGGKLVIPIGQPSGIQSLIRVRRTGEDRYERKRSGWVQFVPLVGIAGWSEVELPKEQ